MQYDLIIIGGGINGAAIAADAAGRGLNVLLCEKNDFASGTSSVSSKLIHGGLRYLEQYDFKLVKESLRERSILLQRAPHLVFPMSFIMPDNAQYHSPMIIGLGLLIYDFLAADKKLPKAKRIQLNKLPMPSHLKKVANGFRYTDCWGNDARLVIANLQLAQQKGATILSRTEFISAQRELSYWNVEMMSAKQTTKNFKTKAIINAAGPWADKVKHAIFPQQNFEPQLQLVKGSHIVIKKFYPGDHAFILQHNDGRIIFLIPFQHDMLIIGTTDIPYDGKLEEIIIDQEEINYLKTIVSDYFDINMADEKIIWHYSGVRPLYNDHQKNASKISRDYYIEYDNKCNLPLITVYGGKLTTHRCLAEDVLTKLKPTFKSMQASWTKSAIFPGGDLNGDFEQFVEICYQEFSQLPHSLINRLARDYGANIKKILLNCHKVDDLGIYFGGDLYEQEIQYLVKNEWAMTTDDILWRRTKQGLYLKSEQITALNTWLQAYNSLL